MHTGGDGDSGDGGRVKQVDLVGGGTAPPRMPKIFMAASDYRDSDMKRRDQKTEAYPGGLLCECLKV